PGAHPSDRSRCGPTESAGTGKRDTGRRGIEPVPYRAFLRTLRAQHAVHAVEQRLRVAHDRGAARARARRARAAAGDLVRIHGGAGLRQAIASLYERTGAEEVVVTSCAEEGIFLLYHALLRPGDHVIVETPCYESALQVARSTGAEVSQWRRRYEDGWAHDLDALARLIRPATRLLYLNQPHNPTGTLMPRPVFEHVIELARAHGLVVFSDEVYRELEHDPADRLPAACDEYERAVSLGSISK